MVQGLRRLELSWNVDDNSANPARIFANTREIRSFSQQPLEQQEWKGYLHTLNPALWSVSAASA